MRVLIYSICTSHDPLLLAHCGCLSVTVCVCVWDGINDAGDMRVANKLCLGFVGMQHAMERTRRRRHHHTQIPPPHPPSLAGVCVYVHIVQKALN